MIKRTKGRKMPRRRDYGSRLVMDQQKARDEVDKNYEAFRAMLPSILPSHQGKYALMRDGAAVGFYSALEHAYMTAKEFYKDQTFSVPKVTDFPTDFGSFSCCRTLVNTVQ